MSKRSRRKFTDELKAEAVKLVTEEGYQIAEAARNLGIHENLHGRWEKTDLKTKIFCHTIA